MKLMAIKMALLGMMCGVWLVSSIAAANAQTSEIRFNGDFETGDLSQYRLIQECASDRITVYSQVTQPSWPAPRQGKYAARFNVFDTDVAPCTPTENPRAQALGPSFINLGDEYWATFSVYFPTNMPDIPPSGGWIVIQSFYSDNFGGDSGLAHLMLTQHSNGSTVWYYPGTNWTLPVIRGRWEDFLIHVKFSKDPTVGFVELWYNGVQQKFPNCNCTKIFKQTVNTGMTGQLHSKALQYRKSGMWPGPVAIFIDNHKVGTTRAAVELIGTITSTPTPLPTVILYPTLTPIPGYQLLTPLAANITASANDGNVPGNTVDNDLNTRWSAQGEGQWIQFDLGKVYTIGYLTIGIYQGDRYQKDFEIQVSNDGQKWQTVLQRTSSGTTNQQELYDFADVGARYIRYVGHTAGGTGWVSLTEVDIYGKDTSVSGQSINWKKLLFDWLTNLGDTNNDGKMNSLDWGK